MAKSAPIAFSAVFAFSASSALSASTALATLRLGAALLICFFAIRFTFDLVIFATGSCATEVPTIANVSAIAATISAGDGPRVPGETHLPTFRLRADPQNPHWIEIRPRLNLQTLPDPVHGVKG